MKKLSFVTAATYIPLHRPNLNFETKVQAANMHAIIIDHRLVDPGILTFIMVGCKTLLICIADIKKCIRIFK